MYCEKIVPTNKTASADDQSHEGISAEFSNDQRQPGNSL